jgi:hypothetical protein
MYPMVDRATKVGAGSKFSAESNWINAAVKFNEALMAFKIPDYLDTFTFSSTDWQSKRTASRLKSFQTFDSTFSGTL